jgi:hypothetical protein
MIATARTRNVRNTAKRVGTKLVCESDVVCTYTPTEDIVCLNRPAPRCHSLWVVVVVKVIAVALPLAAAVDDIVVSELQCVFNRRFGAAHAFQLKGE